MNEIVYALSGYTIKEDQRQILHCEHCAMGWLSSLE